MERTNGKMTSTQVEVGRSISRAPFSPYNYILDNFTDIHAVRCWPMVDTVKECVESFNKLITKSKLTIHESKTNTTSRAAKTTKQR